MSFGVNLISPNPSLNVSWARCYRVEGLGGEPTKKVSGVRFPPPEPFVRRKIAPTTWLGTFLNIKNLRAHPPTT